MGLNEPGRVGKERIMSGIDPSGMSEATQALLWVIGLLASGGGCYMLGAKKKVLYDGGKPIVIMDVVCSHKTRDVSKCAFIRKWRL